MVEIIEYGVEYGDCVGYCRSVLRFCDGAVDLVQTSCDPEEPPRRFSGVLDPELVEAIGEAVRVAGPVTTSGVIGDPDAADEGATTLILKDGDRTIVYTYSRGGPPTGFQRIDALVGPILWGWIDGEPVDGFRFEDSPSN